jgi:DNA-binding MarR family transcriptional regulator
MIFMENEDMRNYLRRKAKLSKEITKLSKSVRDNGYDLGGSQLDCLLYLGAFGYDSSSDGVTKGDVKDFLGETRDLTRFCRKLEDRGFVHDVVSNDDRRSRRIMLTKAGEKVYQRILENE